MDTVWLCKRPSCQQVRSQWCSSWTSCPSWCCHRLARWIKQGTGCLVSCDIFPLLYIVDDVAGIPSTTWANSVVYVSERRCMSSSGHSAITSSKSLDLTRLKVFSFLSISLASHGMDRHSERHWFLCQVTGPPAGEVGRPLHRGAPSAFGLRTRSCRWPWC